MGLAEGACPWTMAVRPMGQGEEAALHSPEGGRWGEGGEGREEGRRR